MFVLCFLLVLLASLLLSVLFCLLMASVSGFLIPLLWFLSEQLADCAWSPQVMFLNVLCEVFCFDRG